MQDLENIKTEVPTAITPENNSKEIKKEDLDLLLDNVSTGYLSLAGLLISRMEVLEILTPVVDPVLLKTLEEKCTGLTLNMRKLEDDLDILKTESEKIDELLKVKESGDGDAVKKAELELIPRFETLIYRTGDINNGLESLSEYYFVNIQAVVDSLESNAREKHKKLSDTLDKLNSEKDEELNKVTNTAGEINE